MLLVGGAHFTRADMRIVSLRFIPEGDRIVAETETVGADPSNRYYVYGEDRARAAASRTLGANRAPNRDATFLRKLSLRAVQAGIAVGVDQDPAPVREQDAEKEYQPDRGADGRPPGGSHGALRV